MEMEEKLKKIFENGQVVAVTCQYVNNENESIPEYCVLYDPKITPKRKKYSLTGTSRQANIYNRVINNKYSLYELTSYSVDKLEESGVIKNNCRKVVYVAPEIWGFRLGETKEKGSNLSIFIAEIVGELSKNKCLNRVEVHYLNGKFILRVIPNIDATNKELSELYNIAQKYEQMSKKSNRNSLQRKVIVSVEGTSKKTKIGLSTLIVTYNVFGYNQDKRVYEGFLSKLSRNENYYARKSNTGLLTRPNKIGRDIKRKVRGIKSGNGRRKNI